MHKTKHRMRIWPRIRPVGVVHPFPRRRAGGKKSQPMEPSAAWISEELRPQVWSPDDSEYHCSEKDISALLGFEGVQCVWLALEKAEQLAIYR